MVARMKTPAPTTTTIAAMAIITAEDLRFEAAFCDPLLLDFPPTGFLFEVCSNADLDYTLRLGK